MGVKRTFNYLLGFAVLLAVFLVGRPAWADSCSTDGGVTCCGRVYSSGGFCCWSVGCSDGTSDGGCSACIQARVSDGVQNKGKSRNGMSKKDTIALLRRISLKDKNLSRSIRSLLDKPSAI
jgi:hypothetical protein